VIAPLALALALCAVQETRPVERLAEWPPLPGKETRPVQEAIFSLKRARTPERLAEISEALEAYGAAVVPKLLLALRSADEEAHARIVSLLDRLTGPEHADLLAKEFREKDAARRLYAVRRCATFGDPKISEAFARLLRDPDPEVAFAAALGCAHSGSLSSLDALRRAAREQWRARGEAIREALAGVRGKAATEAIAASLKSSDPKEVVTALRLLSGAGETESASLVAPFLDDSDALVKLEAVNALRGIVDGHPPLVDPSTFDLIGHVNRWKEKLARR